MGDSISRQNADGHWSQAGENAELLDATSLCLQVADGALPSRARPHDAAPDGTISLFHAVPLSTCFRNPAENFDFLLRFTYDDGLAHVFQSDSVIRALPGYAKTDLGSIGLHITLPSHAPQLFGPCSDLVCTTDQSPDEYDGYAELESNDWDFLPEHSDTEFQENACEIDESSHFEPQDHSHADSLLGCSSEPMLAKAAEIVAGLSQLMLSRSRVLSPSHREEDCSRFFAPTNLWRYLALYFQVWHPNCPFIHIPTFDPFSTSPLLLAAISLLGACHSPDVEDHFEAQTWFDLVEEWVFASFDQGPYADLRDEPLGLERRRAAVQTLQAAYSVCIYQNWDGDSRSKWRIRHQRFPVIVDMTRTLNIASARHDQGPMADGLSFDWLAFVRQEEIIRTIMWVYLLDTAFVIFYQMPPRMLVREMHNELTYPEVCFQAETAKGCFDKIREWLPTPQGSSRPTSFYALIKTLCGQDLEPEKQRMLAREAFMNHWAAIGALHVILFNMEAAIASVSHFQPIEHGMENWKCIWNHIVRDGSVDFPSPGSDEKRHLANTGEIWKRAGFWWHAPEYWLLLRVILDRIISSKRSIEAAKELSGGQSWLGDVEPHVAVGCGGSGMDHVKQLIGSFHGMKVSAG